jgi:hypothetical protein
VMAAEGFSTWIALVADDTEMGMANGGLPLNP